MEPQEFQLLVIQSLSRLETHMADLVGNGQPGRVQKLEERVDSLRRWRWLITGGVIAVSALIHFLFRY